MTTVYNTFQDSLIQYAGYTGTTGGVVPPFPPPSGGNVQYYTGVPTSIPNGTVVVYSLPIQGQIGDVFKMFLSGFYDGNLAKITVNFDGSTNCFYDTASTAGGGYMFELTVSVIDATQVYITNTGYSSATISAVSPQNILSQKFGAGTRSMNMVVGVPLTVTLSHSSSVSVDAFSIFKYSQA